MDDDVGVGISVDELEALRAQAEEATQKLAALEREHAFARAGLDFSDRKTTYFTRAYDGELTPEAIRAEWDASFTPGRSGVPAAELEAHEEMARAGAGAGEPGSGGFLDALSKASSAEEVMELAGRHNLPTTWNRSE